MLPGKLSEDWLINDSHQYIHILIILCHQYKNLKVTLWHARQCIIVVYTMTLLFQYSSLPIMPSYSQVLLHVTEYVHVDIPIPIVDCQFRILY